MRRDGLSFSKDFVWGAATAAYQIEGANMAEGRGECVWDMLCRKPGAVQRGESGAVACDHYNRYPEDVALMKGLGLDAYRFSFGWPRLFPSGTGERNEPGFDFYDRLIDELLLAGIEPWGTMFHWDYPVDLYHRGGWMNPDSPKWFADYATSLAERYSDRVRHWFTLNEPQCFIGLGLQVGVHAPGDKLAWKEVLLAAHHSMLAHGLAVQALRATAKGSVQIGMAPVGSVSVPASESPADIEAARMATESVTKREIFSNSWWMDPVLLGHYPEEGLATFGPDVPRFSDSDLATMCQPLDFFGVNTYQAQKVRMGSDGQPEVVERPTGAMRTAFDWPVEPDCLYWMARFAYERYKLPIVVTENGLSNIDWVALDGGVHDPQRIDYLARHLQGVSRAISDGVDVRGYFQWSLLDNFEWAEGYKQRFGLIYVDYETQKRTPKDSYYWYRDLIASCKAERTPMSAVGKS